MTNKVILIIVMNYVFLKIFYISMLKFNRKMYFNSLCIFQESKSKKLLKLEENFAGFDVNDDLTNIIEIKTKREFIFYNFLYHYFIFYITHINYLYSTKKRYKRYRK